MKTRLALIFILSVSIPFLFNGCVSTQNSGNLSAQELEIDTVAEMENAEEPVSLETFQDSLSGYGEFIGIDSSEIDPDNSFLDENNNEGVFSNVDDDIYYNYIWVPNSSYLYEGWSPYGDGRWVWTDWGWTWVSDYSWGWAPYHYGRWWYSNAYGWVWSTGRRWGPGWVNWCNNGGYTGWYPISPRVRLGNAGISHVNHHYFNNGWVVINKTSITKHINISSVITGEKKNEILSKSTKYVNISQKNRKLINTGPGVDEISKITGQKIVQKHLTEVITFHVPKVSNKNVTNNNSKKNKSVDNNNTNILGNKTITTNDANKNVTVPKSKTNVNSVTNYNTTKTYNSTETYDKKITGTKTNSNQNNNNKNENTNKNINQNTETNKKTEVKKTENNNNYNNSNKTETSNKTGSTSPKVVPGPKYNPPAPKVTPPTPKQTPPPQKQSPPQQKQSSPPVKKSPF